MEDCRPAARAGQFYPGDAESIGRSIAEFAEEPFAPVCAERVYGGLVPHAGWVYSGAVAHGLLRVLGESSPERVVLLGAVHVAGIQRPSFGPWRAWAIPGGEVTVDVAFQDALAARGVAELNRRAHLGEHSIEVQLPLLAAELPRASIVPLAVPPTQDALALGDTLGELLRDEPRTTVIASTDLTHYGEEYYRFAPAGAGPVAVDWARENDERFLARVVELDAQGALADARAHRSACGSGAVAAAIRCVRRLGATCAEVLTHTTSLAVKGDASNFVGYAAVAFV